MPCSVSSKQSFELSCKVFPCPPSDLLQDIGLLAWLSVKEVKHIDQTMKEKTELTLSNDRDRFAWSHHQLYRTKSKEELAKLCRNMKLQSNGNKHELVRTLAENSGQCQPHVTIYNGELDSIPKQSTLLSKFSVGQLRDILHYHGFYCLGSKEELVVRVAENRLRCFVCSHEGRDLKTIFRCEKCNLPLCVTRERNCFKRYHSKAYHQG